MSVEEIKKALEGVTPERLRYEADAMFAAVQGEQYGETHHAYNWADKPHRVLYDAIGLMRNSASTLESLQRENEELRKDKDHIGAEKAGIAKNALNNVDYWKSQAEAAEAEVKHLQAEIDRKSSMSGDHRYWEGRYRDEAAENEKLRELLTPFAKFDLSELKQRAFLQILVCPEGDDHADNYGPHFHRARQALASTGGEHNAE